MIIGSSLQEGKDFVCVGGAAKADDLQPRGAMDLAQPLDQFLPTHV